MQRIEPDRLISVEGIDLGKPKALFSRSGRYVRAAPIRKEEGTVHLAVDATLRAAATRSGGSGFAILPADLRKKVRRSFRSTLFLFVVDASESMGSYQRMAAAKGAALALLTNAYRMRNRVALITFSGGQARVLLPPTNSVTLARHRLKELPVGGATPFAHGLLKAWELVKSARIKDPEMEPILVVISDGEANVPLPKGKGSVKDLLEAAHMIRKEKIHAVAIDTECSIPKKGEMRKVAQALGAAYYPVSNLRVSTVVEALTRWR